MTSEAEFWPPHRWSSPNPPSWESTIHGKYVYLNMLLSQNTSFFESPDFLKKSGTQKNNIFFTSSICTARYNKHTFCTNNVPGRWLFLRSPLPRLSKTWETEVWQRRSIITAMPHSSDASCIIIASGSWQTKDICDKQTAQQQDSVLFSSIDESRSTPQLSSHNSRSVASGWSLRLTNCALAEPASSQESTKPIQG